MAHQSWALQCSSGLKKIHNEITVEQFPRIEGRQMVMMVSPKSYEAAEKVIIFGVRFCAEKFIYAVRRAD
jgi:hypothetical protein